MAREKSGPRELLTVKDIQAWLKTLADRVGGQNKLADLIGVSHAKLSYVINGNQLPSPKIERFLEIERAGMRWLVKPEVK